GPNGRADQHAALLFPRPGVGVSGGRDLDGLGPDERRLGSCATCRKSVPDSGDFTRGVKRDVACALLSISVRSGRTVDGAIVNLNFDGCSRRKRGWTVLVWRLVKGEQAGT